MLSNPLTTVTVVTILISLAGFGTYFVFLFAPVRLCLFQSGQRIFHEILLITKTERGSTAVGHTVRAHEMGHGFP